MARPGRSAQDWERIEAQYRAGTLSIREIARQHNITEPAIRQRAKSHGWERDLSDKVNQKVRNELLRIEASQQTSHESKQSDEEIVDGASRTKLGVVLSHRKGIAKVLKIIDALEEQLALAVAGRPAFQEAIEALTADDKTDQRYNALMRLVALPTHVIAVKDLAQAKRTLYGLERQAFSLGELDDPTPPEKTDDVSPSVAAINAARERQIMRLKAIDEEKRAA